MTISMRIFFSSSRRRHTRLQGDWSSDVCSSDLVMGQKELSVNEIIDLLGWPQPMVSKHLAVLKKVGLVREHRAGRQRLYRVDRSEERRGGKEGGARWGRWGGRQDTGRKGEGKVK